MKMFPRPLIIKALSSIGYELKKIQVPAQVPVPEPFDPWMWVRETQHIQTIIDIGANTGEFAAYLSSYFQARATYVFEPLNSCGKILEEKAAHIPNFHVFNLALSDHSTEEPLYENSYTPSSSLLHVSERHKAEFPGTDKETPTTVQVRPLDELLDSHALEKNILIKIDVQGVEDRVIRGGQKIFSATQCVLIEMSFELLYEQQASFEEVHALLVELGFRFAGFKNQQLSSRSCQPLQAHCFYVRAAKR